METATRSPLASSFSRINSHTWLSVSSWVTEYQLQGHFGSLFWIISTFANIRAARRVKKTVIVYTYKLETLCHFSFAGTSLCTFLLTISGSHSFPVISVRYTSASGAFPHMCWLSLTRFDSVRQHSTAGICICITAGLQRGCKHSSFL